MKEKLMHLSYYASWTLCIVVMWPFLSNWSPFIAKETMVDCIVGFSTHIQALVYPAAWLGALPSPCLQRPPDFLIFPEPPGKMDYHFP